MSASRAQSAGGRSPRRRKVRRLGGRISPRASLATSIAAFAVIVLMWWALTASGAIAPLFLPSPQQVLAALVDQARSGELFSDIGISSLRIGVGYLIATAMALPLGVLMGSNPWWRAAVEPVMDFVRYMPVVAFVPLTIIWAGTDESQKYLIIWLGTFFQQVLMIQDAVRTVPERLINLGESLGLTRDRILTRIVVPEAMPRIWDALRISLGWAWTWLVVAELVAATSGLGYRITVAQRYFSTDLIIAYVVVLGLLGLMLDQLLRALGRRFFDRRKAHA